MIGKFRRQLILGISLLEDVPVSYGLDDSPTTMGMRFLPPQVKGSHQPNQKFAVTPIKDLQFNDLRRQRMLKQRTEECKEVGDRASEVESFDLNGEPKREFGFYEQRIPWDPNPTSSTTNTGRRNN